MILPLKGLFDQAKDFFQRRVEFRGVFAACLGHLRPTAAGATHFGRQRLDEITGFDFRREIFCDDDEQRHLPVVRHGPQGDDTAFHLVPQLVGQHAPHR